MFLKNFFNQTLLKKTFCTTAKWCRFSNNHLSILNGGNFVSTEFFNEDDFVKTVLETTIRRRFYQNCLRLAVILI